MKYAPYWNLTSLQVPPHSAITLAISCGLAALGSGCTITTEPPEGTTAQTGQGGLPDQSADSALPASSGGTATADEPMLGPNPDPVLSEVPFETLVTQSFRWKDCDYAVAAVKQVSEVGVNEYGDYRDDWVALELQVTNRVQRENMSWLLWDLILPDGTRFTSDLGDPLQLMPGQTLARNIEIHHEGAIDLTEASIRPHEGALNDHRPLIVPLDAPATTAPDIELGELVGRVFETGDKELREQRRVTILAANISSDSDMDPGWRAPNGKVFVDVLARVQLLGKATSAYFNDDLMDVLTDGYAVPDESDSGVFENNEARDFHFLFELPESIAEFTLRVDTNDEVRPTVQVAIPGAG